MNLTWHITKKDLTRLKLPLVGFGLVLAAQIGIGLTLRAGNGADIEWFNRLALYLKLAEWIEVLVICALVALLVHEDALVGTQVAWRTRPIPSGMLLRSKLVTLALVFGVFPSLIGLPWWLLNGFGAGQMGHAVLESWAVMASTVVPAFAVAAMIDSLGRFISLALVVLALGAFTLLMNIAYVPAAETLTRGVVESRVVLVIAILLAGVIAIVFRQFRCRTVWPSFAILTVVVILIPVVAWGWTHDIFALWRAKTLDSSEVTAGVTVTPTSAGINYEGPASDPIALAESFYVNLRAEGAPKDLVLMSTGCELSWRARSGLLHADVRGNSRYDWYDDTRRFTVVPMLGLPTEVVDEETVRWQEEKHQEMIRKIRERDPKYVTYPKVPFSPEDARKNLHLSFAMRGVAKYEPPKAKTAPEISADFILGRPFLLMELPLQPSRWRTASGRSVRIAQIRSDTRSWTHQGVTESAARRKVDFILTQPEGAWWLPAWGLRIADQEALSTDCWLLTRDLGQATFGGQFGMNGTSVRICGVSVNWRTATVEEPRVIRHGAWTSYRPDWDHKMSMAFFRYDVEAGFRRTMKVERVKDSHQSQEENAEPTSAN